MILESIVALVSIAIVVVVSFRAGKRVGYENGFDDANRVRRPYSHQPVPR